MTPSPIGWVQVTIPPVVPIVHEYRFHALTCGCCGTATRAWDEALLNGSRYGERVVAHVGVLSGQYRQSHRMVQELLRELFGIELCVGSINQLRQESSASVAAAAREAQAYVQAKSAGEQAMKPALGKATRTARIPWALKAGCG